MELPQFSGVHAARLAAEPRGGEGDDVGKHPADGAEAGAEERVGDGAADGQRPFGERAAARQRHGLREDVRMPREQAGEVRDPRQPGPAVPDGVLAAQQEVQRRRGGAHGGGVQRLGGEAGRSRRADPPRPGIVRGKEPVVGFDQKAVGMPERDTPAVMPQVLHAPRVVRSRNVAGFSQAGEQVRVIRPGAQEIEIVETAQAGLRPGLGGQGGTLDQRQPGQAGGEQGK